MAQPVGHQTKRMLFLPNSAIRGRPSTQPRTTRHTSLSPSTGVPPTTSQRALHHPTLTHSHAMCSATSTVVVAATKPPGPSTSSRLETLSMHRLAKEMRTRGVKAQTYHSFFRWSGQTEWTLDHMGQKYIRRVIIWDEVCRVLRPVLETFLDWLCCDLLWGPRTATSDRRGVPAWLAPWESRLLRRYDRGLSQQVRWAQGIEEGHSAAARQGSVPGDAQGFTPVQGMGQVRQ